MEQQKPKCSQVNIYHMEVKRTLSSLHKEKDAEQLKNGLSFVSQSIPFPFEDKMKLSRCYSLHKEKAAEQFKMKLSRCYYEMKGNKINKILLISFSEFVSC
jgi:hypothetical protein